MHEITYESNDPTLIKKLVWATDMHFNEVGEEEYRHFIQEIQSHDADALLVGGDISDGVASFVCLEELQEKTGKDVYYVLGNHDYYFSSITEVRSLAEETGRRNPRLHYLTQGEHVPLNDKTVLIGHDCWADGRAGNFLESTVVLKDYSCINDLKDLKSDALLEKLNALGDEAASDVEASLQRVMSNHENVIFLTHTPPFNEACKYRHNECDGNWGPHFVCVAVGNVLKRYAEEHPEKNLLILCGHAHSDVDVQILPNLRSLTGDVVLGAPKVQGVIRL